MLKLKLQYFGHLMQRADSLEKTLMLGKIAGRRWGHQRMRWLDGIINTMYLSFSKLWKILEDSKLWEIVKDRASYLSGRTELVGLQALVQSFQREGEGQF